MPGILIDSNILIRLLTLNAPDFARYEGIRCVSPSELLAYPIV